MKHIDIYTDGSEKHWMEDVVFGGYLIVDDEIETYKTFCIDKGLVTKKLIYATYVNSNSAEYISLISSLEECLKYKNTTFNIYTDFVNNLSATDTFIGKSTSKGFKTIKNKFLNLIEKNNKLGNTINILWVESHKECWGNLKIDNLINRFAYKHILKKNKVLLKSSIKSLQDKIKYLDSVL